MCLYLNQGGIDKPVKLEHVTQSTVCETKVTSTNSSSIANAADNAIYPVTQRKVTYQSQSNYI